MVNKHGNDWAKLLPHVVFQLNCSLNTSLGHSPYFLVHGRIPRTIDMVVNPDELQDTDEDTDFVCRMKKNQYEAYLLTKEICKIQGARMKKYYDLHSRPHKISIGSIVYLYRPTKDNEKCMKLSTHYVGPFVVTELLDNNKVLIVDRKTRKLYPFSIHVSRLKLARHMEDYQESSEDDE